ncbi:hypothetical protein B9Q02_02835 [Candidatus Marsarchaeota G1 archaeon BE_D]|uniref:Uncharacterized protein n=1 Tax=Candidatus Marsarchaeota G1 archaeon BE_D TaxID=1978156 RepID=A0A2R6AIX2_9ARCH|nr:MAG: hypothetical protein B9Q02_02835 [Candidatus Marsarchaeota G1 archaeon BE_D]
MNLNSHILFAMAVGMAVFHDVKICVLLGIGAALPDLDREYILTNKLSLAKHQLHRALFHNIFFAFGMYLFNPFLGLGVILHIMLDMLTSPTDRGVEVLFPLDRIIQDFHLDYDGILKEKRRILWYLEDPLRVITRTTEKELAPTSKSPWVRVYGPFKNSRIADWTVFYSSIIFLILFDSQDLVAWTLQLLLALKQYFPLITGIVLFYMGGEIWRRKLQSSGKGRTIIAVLMLSGVAVLVYGCFRIFSPPSFIFDEIKTIVFAILSFLTGVVIAFVHVKKRHKIATL